VELVFLLIGLLVGSLGAWLVAKYRHASRMGLTSEEAEAMRKQIGDLSTDIARATQANAMLSENLRQSTIDLAAERGKVVDLSTDFSRAQTESQNLQEKLESQKKELEELQTRMTEQFQNIASKILTDNAQLIQQQHKQKLEDVLNPLKERIQQFQEKVDSTHKESIRDSQSLKEQISVLQKLNQTIGEEAKNLTTALKGQTKTQGNWGEMILENLLEKSGLVKGREYTVQEMVSGEQGKRYLPDVIVHLPENRKIIVDSKVSLTAYERFCNTDNDEERDSALKEHVASLRKHIKELSAKNYQNADDLQTLDFVLMFVPVEPAFTVVAAADMSIFNEALEKNIVLVTPSTLLATLRTIASMWKQEKQNRNALEIAREGGALYDKLVGLMNDLIELGNRIKQAQGSYEDAMKKLHTGTGNLLSRAENIRQLGAKTSKVFPQQLLDRVEQGEQIKLIE
jgi:DNA recombination protein RmuC